MHGLVKSDGLGAIQNFLWKGACLCMSSLDVMSWNLLRNCLEGCISMHALSRHDVLGGTQDLCEKVHPFRTKVLVSS